LHCRTGEEERERERMKMSEREGQKKRELSKRIRGLDPRGAD
jgi:hypothetical protein